MNKPEARHIYALGSPWTEATGMVLVSGCGRAREEINELALTSCSTEMALEPLRKMLGRIHGSHTEITNLHPELQPVRKHIARAMSEIRKAESCYMRWHKKSWETMNTRFSP